MELVVDAGWITGMLLASIRIALFVAASPIFGAAIPAVGRVALVLVLGYTFADPVTTELTFGFFAAASLLAFVVNEQRERPGLGGDVGVGALVGLSLLGKFTGLLPLLALLASLATRVRFATDRSCRSPQSSA